MGDRPASPPVTGPTRTDEIPAGWDERALLATMLDYVRDTVHIDILREMADGVTGR